MGKKEYYPYQSFRTGVFQNAPVLFYVVSEFSRCLSFNRLSVFSHLHLPLIPKILQDGYAGNPLEHLIEVRRRRE